MAKATAEFYRSQLAPLVGNAALSGVGVHAFREWEPGTGADMPLSAALYKKYDKLSCKFLEGLNGTYI
jgi:hypothetical protein